MLLYTVLIGLLILVLMVPALRWFLRKVRMRHVWAGIRTEREELKQAFSRLVVQVDLLAQQWQAHWSALQASRAPAASAPGPQWNVDVPEFPQSQWLALKKSGSDAFMQPEALREVEELYVDVDKLRTSIVAASAALAAARGAGPGSDTERARAVNGALRTLIADMRQFQALHTDFAAAPPDSVLPAAT